MGQKKESSSSLLRNQKIHIQESQKNKEMAQQQQEQSSSDLDDEYDSQKKVNAIPRTFKPDIQDKFHGFLKIKQTHFVENRQKSCSSVSISDKSRNQPQLVSGNSSNLVNKKYINCNHHLHIRDQILSRGKAIKDANSKLNEKEQMINNLAHQNHSPSQRNQKYSIQVFNIESPNKVSNKKSSDKKLLSKQYVFNSSSPRMRNKIESETRHQLQSLVSKYTTHKGQRLNFQRIMSPKPGALYDKAIDSVNQCLSTPLIEKKEPIKSSIVHSHSLRPPGLKFPFRAGTTINTQSIRRSSTQINLERKKSIKKKEEKKEDGMGKVIVSMNDLFGLQTTQSSYSNINDSSIEKLKTQSNSDIFTMDGQNMIQCRIDTEEMQKIFRTEETVPLSSCCESQHTRLTNNDIKSIENYVRKKMKMNSHQIFRSRQQKSERISMRVNSQPQVNEKSQNKELKKEKAYLQNVLSVITLNNRFSLAESQQYFPHSSTNCHARGNRSKGNSEDSSQCINCVNRSLRGPRSKIKYIQKKKKKSRNQIQAFRDDLQILLFQRNIVKLQSDFSKRNQNLMNEVQYIKESIYQAQSIKENPIISAVKSKDFDQSEFRVIVRENYDYLQLADSVIIFISYQTLHRWDLHPCTGLCQERITKHLTSFYNFVQTLESKTNSDESQLILAKRRRIILQCRQVNQLIKFQQLEIKTHRIKVNENLFNFETQQIFLNFNNLMLKFSPQLLAIFHSKLLQNQTIQQIYTSISQNKFPNLKAITSTKTIPCSIIIQRVPVSVIDQKFKEKYLSKQKKELMYDEEDSDNEDENKQQSSLRNLDKGFILFYLKKSDFTEHVDPQNSPHPHAIFNAAMKIAPNHKKIAILELVKDSFQNRKQESYYEDVFLPKMVLLFNCDILQTYSSFETIEHLRAYLKDITSLDLLKKTSVFKKKKMKVKSLFQIDESSDDKQQSLIKKSWMGQLITLPGISENRAIQIVNKFPTPASLIKFMKISQIRKEVSQMKDLSFEEKKQKMQQMINDKIEAIANVEIATSASNSKIGMSMAKKLFKFFQSSDRNLQVFMSK